jgi:hypothetical protein
LPLISFITFAAAVTDTRGAQGQRTEVYGHALKVGQSVRRAPSTSGLKGEHVGIAPQRAPKPRAPVARQFG